MLVVGNFATLDALAGKIGATFGNVQAEVTTWLKEAGITAESWQDLSGEEFKAVSEAWRQVTEAEQEMLRSLGLGVDTSNEALQTAVALTRSRIASGGY